MKVVFARVALALLLGAAVLAGAAEAPSQAPAPTFSRAVMTGDQVVEILDKTVEWYRTLGVQQQAATQPSDLLILYANRQTADKVMALAFEIARANAELISSEAGVAEANADTASRSIEQARSRLDTQRKTIQSQIDSVKGELASAPADKTCRSAGAHQRAAGRAGSHQCAPQHARRTWRSSPAPAMRTASARMH